MKKLLTIFLFAISIIANSQTQDWEWAKSGKGAGDDWPNNLATDANGNVYLAFQSYSNFTVFGIDTLHYSGIVKYDNMGNVLWGRNINAWINGLATDASNNVYVSGWFAQDTAIFGNDTLYISTHNSSDMFLVKFDDSGTELWARSAGGNSGAQSIATDANNNVYITGLYYDSTIIFKNDTLINYSIVNTYQNNNLFSDLFIAKYDSSGNVIWAKSAGGKYDDAPSCITIDIHNNIYVAGYTDSDTISFANDTLINSSYIDYDTNEPSGNMLLLKFDNSGNKLWARSAGGEYNDCSVGVVTDASDNVYITGNYRSSSITFGTHILVNLSDFDYEFYGEYLSDLFIVKYNSSGAVQWATTVGSNADEYACGIAIDSGNDLYIAGSFASLTINFGGQTLVNANPSVCYSDMFLAKYDYSGNALWAKSAGGNNVDGATNVATDVYGNVYITGSFTSPSITFKNDILVNSGGSDDEIFLAKLGDITGINETAAKNNEALLYPNPANERLLIVTSNNSCAAIEIFDLHGQLVKSHLVNENQTLLNIFNLIPGMYFVKITTDKGVITKKFIKE